MAMYKYIEIAEKVFRDVPKNENQVVFIARSGADRLDGYLLQRGSYIGDVWWDTPDGESIFNRFRVTGSRTECRTFSAHDKEDREESGYAVTACTLAVPFTGADYFIVAGRTGCETEKGSDYVAAYTWSENDTLERVEATESERLGLKKWWADMRAHEQYEERINEKDLIEYACGSTVN
jgi:hypothetical protein